MNVQQVIAWVQAGQLLVSVGAATVETIRGWVKGQNPDMTDAELNTILDAVIAGAAAHKALADADAGKK